MEVLAVLIVIALVFLLLSPRKPTEGDQRVEPNAVEPSLVGTSMNSWSRTARGREALGSQSIVVMDDDPLTEGELVAAYLAQCTAARPCVATSDRYDVDSVIVAQQSHERPLLNDAGVPFDNWYRWQQEQRQYERAGKRSNRR